MSVSALVCSLRASAVSLQGKQVDAGEIHNQRVDDVITGDKLLVLQPMRIVGRLPDRQGVVHPALQGKDAADQGEAEKQEQAQAPAPAQGGAKKEEKTLHGQCPYFFRKALVQGVMNLRPAEAMAWLTLLETRSFGPWVRMASREERK